MLAAVIDDGLGLGRDDASRRRGRPGVAVLMLTAAKARVDTGKAETNGACKEGQDVFHDALRLNDLCILL